MVIAREQAPGEEPVDRVRGDGHGGHGAAGAAEGRAGGTDLAMAEMAWDETYAEGGGAGRGDAQAWQAGTGSTRERRLRLQRCANGWSRR